MTRNKFSTHTLDLAQRLAQEFAIRADKADRLGRLPQEDVQALKDSGYLGSSIPQEYGGWGLSLQECLAAQVELAQGSGSTALVAGMQLHLFGHARETHPWPETIFAWLCQEAINGGLFNHVASEPLLGSPFRGGLPATTAVSTPKGWIINGHKTWITGGKHLTHLLVNVRIEDDPAWILIYQDTPGVEWIETWHDSFSLRASDSHDVYFKNVEVPANHLLQRGATQAVPNVWFPLIISGVYLGIAIAARNVVIRYAMERVPTVLGKPIATLPKIQRQIGEIDLAILAAQTLLFETARQWAGKADHRRQIYPRIVAAKHLTIETANEVTDKALRIAGGISLTKVLALERYFRDVRAGLMQPPAGDTALEIIGQNALERYNKNRR